MKISINKIQDLFSWFLSNDTGCSSMTICAWMLGLNYDHATPPSDEGDRGRCIGLLKIMPEWLERLDEMKILSEKWSEQIELIKLSSLGGEAEQS